MRFKSHGRKQTKLMVRTNSTEGSKRAEKSFKALFSLFQLEIAGEKIVYDGGVTLTFLSSGQSMQEALTFGCRIAGKKCGIQGYDGIVS